MPNTIKPTIAPDLLNDLIDPTGQPLAIGTRVRSFDFVMPYKSQGQLLGVDLDGDLASYVEGTVKDIGIEIEGCERYQIRVDRRILGGQETSLAKVPQPFYVFPPVNGTPHLAGGCTAGVFAL